MLWKVFESMFSVIWKYVMDILMNALKQILTIDLEEGEFWVLEFQYYVSTMLKAKRYWGGQGKLDETWQQIDECYGW